MRAKADHYARVQKRLQRKGTRSATRRRIAIGQRERRLKLNTNHTISQAHPGHPSPRLHRPGRALWHSRADQAQARQEGDEAGKRRSQSARLQVGLCGVAWAARLQGGPGRVSCCIKVDADYTSQACPRCGYTSRAEPSPARPALCLPAVPVHPPCRSGGCQEYLLANAGHPAGLDGHGAVVRCP